MKRAPRPTGGGRAEPLLRWAASDAGGALAFALAAVLGMLCAWGFRVDDALVSARVAEHIAGGLGYRFNPAGPSVDCVTPLGWAQVLAAFAGGGPAQTVARAACAGSVLWALSALRLGQLCCERCTGARRVGLWLCLASSLPLAAWAVSGMDTAWVLALAVAALQPNAWGAACAGLAAAWRPELVPWAVTLSFGQALAERRPPSARALALLLALLPALGVAALRWAIWGRPVPLAVFAKPSDVGHGLRYAFGVLAFSGPPYLLLATGAWRRVAPRYWAMAAAFLVHVVILVGIGGDWMPFWRLAVPALPGVLVVGAALARESSAPACAARVLLVLAAALLLHVGKGQAARSVSQQERALMAGLAPLLDGAERIGTVDVGWVGATRDVQVVDLAGVTDEEVAFLPGGHTSKRLPRDFLERRQVDTLVLRRAAQRELGGAERWVYAVDARALGLRGAGDFVRVGEIAVDARDPVAVGGEAYVVLRRPHALAERSLEMQSPAEDAP